MSGTALAAGVCGKKYTEVQPFALVATSGFVPAQKTGTTTKLLVYNTGTEGAVSWRPGVG